MISRHLVITNQKFNFHLHGNCQNEFRNTKGKGSNNLRRLDLFDARRHPTSQCQFDQSHLYKLTGLDRLRKYLY